LFELNHFHRSLPLVLEATEERMGCKIDPITRRGIESRCMAAHLKPLSIDAIECGNVARFINNRDIEPNCGVQPVLTAQNHSTIFYRCCPPFHGACSAFAIAASVEHPVELSDACFSLTM
jgi:hypothetical protein